MLGNPRACFRSAFILLSCLALSVGVPPLEGQEEIGTAAEESGFDRYTSYAEMMEYLEELRAASAEFRMGIYGETRQGRELPYLVFSRPQVTRGWEAAALGRPVVELHANVHGGERTLRESLLILVRKLATPGTPENDLLDHMVIVVSPQLNPDGFEASEDGIRGNAWGIDLNRDYMKLEHPSVVNWVRNVFQEWNPHIFVDGHNGGSFPYNIKYQCPGHADPDSRLTELCDDHLFPRVDERLGEEGFRSFFWAGGDEDAWRGGRTEARISRNYAGFVNSVGVLFESPGWQERADGIRSGLLAYTAVLEFVRDHPDELMDTVNQARKEAVLAGSEPRGDVVVEMDVEPEAEPVDYLIGVGEGDEREIVEIRDAPIYKRPVPVTTRPRPYAYMLPRDAVAAVELLQRHNVTVEVLRDSLTVEVEAYTLEGVSHEEAYNHQAATVLELGDVVREERSFPPGTYVVPVGQMMGRVVTHLLEPETLDNVVYWGTMDPWLPLAKLEAWQGGEEDVPPLVPIYRVPAPTPFPARITE